MALSLQLLRIAEFLSDNASAFLLYFNDISLDNYVVSESGKVVIADAENIVVVDGLQVMSGEYITSSVASDFSRCLQSCQVV